MKNWKLAALKLCIRESVCISELTERLKLLIFRHRIGLKFIIKHAVYNYIVKKCQEMSGISI